MADLDRLDRLVNQHITFDEVDGSGVSGCVARVLPEESRNHTAGRPVALSSGDEWFVTSLTRIRVVPDPRAGKC